MRPKFREALRWGWRLRCPRCGRGALLAGWFRVLRECPSCGLAYYREPGYFIGAMIVNYGVSAGIVVVVYLVSGILPEVWAASVEAKLFAWFAFGILLSLALMPHSRSFWLAFDYWLEPWEP